MTLFVVMQFFINLFVNIDMGILTAGSTKIKEELGIENMQFGFLGSIVYFGQADGWITAGVRFALVFESQMCVWSMSISE